MAAPIVDWNEDRVERLRVMWAGGLSCRKIADALGGNSTRCSIAGKVRRLGLESRQAPFEERALKNRPKPPEIQILPPRSILTVATSEGPLVLENGSLVTMETVSNRTCRWPIGDPMALDFHFCGHAPKKDRPYCDGHCRQAYQPVQEPRGSDRRKDSLLAGQPNEWV